MLYTHFPPFHLCPILPTPLHHPLPNSPAPTRFHSGKEGRRVQMNRCVDLSWMSMDHNAASGSSLLRLSVRLSVRRTLFCFQQLKDLVAAVLFFYVLGFSFLTKLQTGGSDGDQLLGSVDPASAVWFRWLGTLWVPQDLSFFPVFVFSVISYHHDYFIVIISFHLFNSFLWFVFYMKLYLRRSIFQPQQLHFNVYSSKMIVQGAPGVFQVAGFFLPLKPLPDEEPDIVISFAS